MVIADPNFELLLPDDIFFWPIRVVFPEKKKSNVKNFVIGNVTTQRTW